MLQYLNEIVSMNKGDVCVILFSLNKICLLKLRKRKKSQQIPKSITYKVKGTRVFFYEEKKQ